MSKFLLQEHESHTEQGSIPKPEGVFSAPKSKENLNILVCFVCQVNTQKLHVELKAMNDRDKSTRKFLATSLKFRNLARVDHYLLRDCCDFGESLSSDIVEYELRAHNLYDYRFGVGLSRYSLNRSRRQCQIICHCEQR